MLFKIGEITDSEDYTYDVEPSEKDNHKRYFVQLE
jgi:hypothetical protein